MEINKIIRELLAKNDFISLPGIGSFVQKYDPAKISSDGASIIAPKQYIVFDASRTFNDEAIEHYLVIKLGLDHKRASEVLEQFINNLKVDLKSGNDVLFEHVGILLQDKAGNYTLKPLPGNELATSTYGLADIKVENLKKEIPDEKKIHEDKKTPLPISTEHKSNTTKIIIAIAAFVAIVVIVSAFIFIPDLRFWTRFSDKEITKATNVVNETPNQDTDKIAKQEQATTPIDTAKQQVDQTIQSKNEKKAALYYEEPKPQENKTFYLIVGSFSKLENAQKLSEKFTQRGFSTEIIQGNNMFRVSIIKTTDKNEALGEYNKFKTENPNEAAWILGV